MRPPALNPSAYLDTFARDRLPTAEQWPDLLLSGDFVYPDRLNAAGRLLDDAVREGFGDRVAIVSRNLAGTFTETTYRELQRQVDAIAHVLVRDMKLVTGNRVLLRGYNGAPLAAAWLAVLKAGGIAVTTMPMLRATELQAVIDKAQCTHALCDLRLDVELKAAIAGSTSAASTSPANPTALQVRYWTNDSSMPSSLNMLVDQHTDPFHAVQTSSDDVCLIAFTSGTTGVPKGCVHFHRDVMAMCDGFSAQVLKLSSGDRCIGTPPLAFTFGLGALLAFPMFARGSAVLLESATPETLLDAIAQTRATVTATAPTFYRLMALAIEREPARYDTSSLTQSISAGEALPPATRDAWRNATRIEMLDGIGATEMIHIFIAAAGRDVRPGAIGKAVPGYEVTILGEHLEHLSAGETGRLAVRGPTGCRYLADDRQTNYVQHGWNLTGDACTMDADGYVYFKARTDDLIISSGYNIGAPEVEAAVLSHESVAECAVVGLPDAERGQCVTAFVVLKPSHRPTPETARDIQDHVKRTIAPYKYPRSVIFRDALPKTETGKLQRFRLKEST
ncbi:MAG: AMP-binding protein [Gemmatimonas sp.]